MSNFVRGYNSTATENDIEWDAFKAGGKAHERCTTPEYEADKAARKAAKNARKEARKSGSSRVDSPYADTKALLAGSSDVVDESSSRRPAGITPGRFDRSNKAENSATSDKSFADSFAASAKSNASVGSQISEKAKAVGGFVRRASLSLTRRFSSSSVNVSADGDAKVYKTPAEVAAHAEEQEKYRQTAPKHRPQNQKRWLCHRYSKDFNTLLEKTEREPTDAAVEQYFGALAQHRMWATDAVDREPLAMTAEERKQAERSFWPPLVANVNRNAAPPPRTPSPPPAPAGVITTMSVGAARIMAKVGKAKIRESPVLASIRTSVGMPPKKGGLHPVTSLSPDFTDMNVPADMMTACGWEEGPNKGKGCGNLPEKSLTNGICENCRHLPAVPPSKVHHVTGTAPRSPPDDVAKGELYMKIAGRQKLRKVRETLYGGFSGNPFEDESSETSSSSSSSSSRDDSTGASSGDGQCTRRESFWNAPRERKSRASRQQGFAGTANTVVPSKADGRVAGVPQHSPMSWTLMQQVGQARHDRRSMSVDIAFMPPKPAYQDTTYRMSRRGSLPAIRGQLLSGEPFWYDGERDSAFYDFYEELLALTSSATVHLFPSASPAKQGKPTTRSTPYEPLPSPVAAVVLECYGRYDFGVSAEALTSWLNARWAKTGYSVSTQAVCFTLKLNGRDAKLGLGDALEGAMARPRRRQTL
ncbi:hypothetical protein B0A48_07127 [Cryoendolithus antarcticus]|uniref:Uncharacterized protein n=1 Tax=Cryoendolithus antarcticus TaxID=1507870 RepID=A0A1V8T7U9_9PEZI|nr:hypothetical protein B0A48_07127 [Cryoendolithus antarcticus]